jgi:predicted TIM-barrel fold metal-dependent hydrolase
MTEDVVVQAHGRSAGSTSRALKLIDCDIHPSLRSNEDLAPYLSRRWKNHLDTFGFRQVTPFSGSGRYPKATPALARRDAWPDSGGPPGSDLAFLRKQLLDLYRVDYGILSVIFPAGMSQFNIEFGEAVCRALNDWQLEHWTQPEPRLKAGILVQGEAPDLAVREIERLAGKPDYVYVAMTTHNIEPLGRRRYWPIYEAAEHYGLPIGLHVSGYNRYAVTGAGFPAYYFDETHTIAHAQAAVAASFVAEGVFDKFPKLKIASMEGGYTWVPFLGWRMDEQWARLREEVPHLQRRPSEYLHDHFWFSTQPVEDPPDPKYLAEIFEWIGWDRIMFSTDYPHWNMDDPNYALKLPMTAEQRRQVQCLNAAELFGLV